MFLLFLLTILLLLYYLVIKTDVKKKIIETVVCWVNIIILNGR